MSDLTMRERVLSVIRETIDAMLPDGIEIGYHHAVEHVFNELADPTWDMIRAGLLSPAMIQTGPSTPDAVAKV